MRLKLFAAMVKIASDVGAKVPSGPWAGVCAGAVVKGQGAGMHKPCGLRGTRFCPLLRDPEVLDPVALAPGLRVCVLFSGVEWAWLGLPVIF